MQHVLFSAAVFTLVKHIFSSVRHFQGFINTVMCSHCFKRSHVLLLSPYFSDRQTDTDTACKGVDDEGVKSGLHAINPGVKITSSSVHIHKVFVGKNE